MTKDMTMGSPLRMILLFFRSGFTGKYFSAVL